MITSATPTSVSFHGAARGGESEPRPAPAPKAPFVPLMPEETGLRSLTNRALSVMLGSKVDLFV